MTVAMNDWEALLRTRLHTLLTATSDSLVDLAFRVLQSGKAKHADVNALALSFLNITRPNQGVMEALAKLIVESAMIVDFSGQCEWRLRVQHTITTMLSRSAIYKITGKYQQQG